MKEFVLKNSICIKEMVSILSYAWRVIGSSPSADAMTSSTVKNIPSVTILLYVFSYHCSPSKISQHAKDKKEKIWNNQNIVCGQALRAISVITVDKLAFMGKHL